MRPTFDFIYMNLAFLLSERSTCSRKKVGCVIVSDDNQRVLSIGYNGSWRGGPNQCDSTEPGNCGCLHAEDNAIVKLDYNDRLRKVLYTTMSPCSACAKRIINAGIGEVVYLEEYRTKHGIQILFEANVLTRHFIDSFNYEASSLGMSVLSKKGEDSR